MNPGRQRRGRRTLLLLALAGAAALLVFAFGSGAVPTAWSGDETAAGRVARTAADAAAAPVLAQAEPGLREDVSSERRVRVLSAEHRPLPGVAFAAVDRSVRRLPAAQVVARTNDHGVAVLQRSWLEQVGEIAFGRDGYATRTVSAAVVLANRDTLELEMPAGKPLEGQPLEVQVVIGERERPAEDATVVVSRAPSGLGAVAWEPMAAGLPGVDPENAIHVVTTRAGSVLPALPPGSYAAALACPVAVPSPAARAAMRRFFVPGRLVLPLQQVEGLVVALVDDALLHHRAELLGIDTQDPWLAPIRKGLLAAHRNCYVEIGVAYEARAEANLQLMTVLGRRYDGRHSFRPLGPSFRVQRVHATGPALPMGEIDLHVAREFENVEWPHDDLTFVAGLRDEVRRASMVIQLGRGRTRVPEGAWRVVCEGPWRFPAHDVVVGRDAVTRLDFALPSSAIRLVFKALDPDDNPIDRGDLSITQGDYVVSWRDTFRDGPRSVYLREGRARLRIGTKEALYDDDAFFTREMEATGYEVRLEWRR
jgi:hypothetical protein